MQCDSLQDFFQNNSLQYTVSSAVSKLTSRGKTVGLSWILATGVIKVMGTHSWGKLRFSIGVSVSQATPQMTHF